MFIPGDEYTRAAIFDLLRLSPRPEGGNWFTGYHSHEFVHFIFSNVGTGGRTGHDYKNEWQDATHLRWFGKTQSTPRQPQIVAMTTGEQPVHLFWRSDNRAPFTYAGTARAVSVRENSQPVEVVWEVASTNDVRLTEELSSATGFEEGTVKQVLVNAFERSRAARTACIANYGEACAVCEMTFAGRYGEVGRHFIHVHHLVPIATIAKGYVLHPVQDLRPVCPNCHAMLHRTSPPLRIEELRALLARAAG